jgi:hypothetical protein
VGCGGCGWGWAWAWLLSFVLSSLVTVWHSLLLIDAHLFAAGNGTTGTTGTHSSTAGGQEAWPSLSPPPMSTLDLWLGPAGALAGATAGLLLGAWLVGGRRCVHCSWLMCCSRLRCCRCCRRAPSGRVVPLSEAEQQAAAAAEAAAAEAAQAAAAAEAAAKEAEDVRHAEEELEAARAALAAARARQPAPDPVEVAACEAAVAAAEAVLRREQAEAAAAAEIAAREAVEAAEAAAAAESLEHARRSEDAAAAVAAMGVGELLGALAADRLEPWVKAAAMRRLWTAFVCVEPEPEPEPAEAQAEAQHEASSAQVGLSPRAAGEDGFGGRAQFAPAVWEMMERLSLELENVQELVSQQQQQPQAEKRGDGDGPAVERQQREEEEEEEEAEHGDGDPAVAAAAAAAAAEAPAGGAAAAVTAVRWSEGLRRAQLGYLYDIATSLFLTGWFGPGSPLGESYYQPAQWAELGCSEDEIFRIGAISTRLLDAVSRCFVERVLCAERVDFRGAKPCVITCGL